MVEIKYNNRSALAESKNNLKGVLKNI